MTYVIETERLTKIYGKVTVLNGIGISLEAGKIYGLLGRNGAGKTTLMKILTAQVFADEGSVKVFGESPYENRRVLSQICFTRVDQKYPEGFTVRDVLEVSASFFPFWDAEYASFLLEGFQLPPGRRIKALSQGMRSAVGAVVGLASRAPLTILDEPSMGLDVVSRDLFYKQLLEDYAEHPRTILLSTHLIDEVSRLLEHVIVLDRGQILLTEEADRLRAQAFTVTGIQDHIASFSENKTVIGREQFGQLGSATIFGKVETEDRKKASELGLEFSPVSLQQLIVHMTNGKAGAV